MKLELACLLALLAAVPALAQQEKDSVVLPLHPAAAPSPCLKYQLLPPLEERTPGNAVLLYYRAYSPEWQTWRRDPKLMQRASDALQVPLPKMRKDELSWVKTVQALKQVDEAARRSYCDWEMMERMKKEGVGMLLPDVQGLREFGTLLAVRARLEMAEGIYEKAMTTLQTGMKLGRDLGKGPTLIQGLVGLAICNLMLGQVEEMLQQPKAPNLYWALTTLPHPLVDLRMGLAGERAMLEGTVPGLADIEKRALSQEQQQEMVKLLQGLFHDAPFPERIYNWSHNLEGVVLVVKLYPEAKRALIAGGRKPEDMEALPVVQVVVLHALEEYRRLQDDLHRWSGLPYWIARPEVEKTEREIRASRDQLRAAPLSAALLPHLGQVLKAHVRLDRRLAALRCIEAVRLYAAAHDGKLPSQLTDIREAPIPEDPFTGKPFKYHVEGDRAVLSAPAPAGERPVLRGNMLRYELTLQK